MTAEEQLALIRAKLAELFGIAVTASDSEFGEAFDQFIKDAEGEGEEATESPAEEAKEAAPAEAVEAGKEKAAEKAVATMADEEKKVAEATEEAPAPAPAPAPDAEEESVEEEAEGEEDANLKRLVEAQMKEKEGEQEKKLAAKIEEVLAGHKKQMEAMVANYESQMTELKKKNEAMDADVKKYHSELAERKSAEIVKEIKSFEATVEAFLSGVVKEGKMLPTEVPVAKSLLLQADRVNKTLKFSDSGKEVDGTPFDALMASMKARPVVVKFSEETKAVEPEDLAKKSDVKPAEEGVKRFSQAAYPVDATSMKVDTLARQMMAEKNLPYGEAMRLASKEVRNQK